MTHKCNPGAPRDGELSEDENALLRDLQRPGVQYLLLVGMRPETPLTAFGIDIGTSDPPAPTIHEIWAIHPASTPNPRPSRRTTQEE